MAISIGYDFANKEIIKDTTKKIINKDEIEILESIVSVLKNKFNASDFNIVSNTDNYLTLKYKNLDIVRLKYTDKSKWISILMLAKNDRIENENNELFVVQKKKSQLHWKSNLTDNNINKYIKFLENSCIEIDKKNL